MAIRLLAAALIAAVLGGSGVAAESSRRPTVKSPAPPGPPKVAVTLLSEIAAVEPGGSFWVGLHQRIAPGWHTYWTNPGDSGEPTIVDWVIPEGWQAGPLVFPKPERVPVAPLMSYGYTEETVLLTRLTAPAGLTAGAAVTLKARAAWLVCEKICIPEEADVALTLPVAAAKPPAAALEAVTAGQPVKTPVTRAYGCSVKYS
jgi:thiol:disulfide interchange protein DsbD